MKTETLRKVKPIMFGYSNSLSKNHFMTVLEYDNFGVTKKQELTANEAIKMNVRHMKPEGKYDILFVSINGELLEHGYRSLGLEYKPDRISGFMKWQ